MRTITFAVLTALVLGFGYSSGAQAQQKCEPITVTPADAGFKTVGIRRPKVDGVKAGDVISFFVRQSSDLARSGEGVVNVEACGKNTTFYRMRAQEVDAYHAAEILLPETARDVKIRSCSKAAKDACWEGVFDGDFTKWVTLTPVSAPKQANADLKGKYKD